jgi:hypothetical protein
MSIDDDGRKGPGNLEGIKNGRKCFFFTIRVKLPGLGLHTYDRDLKILMEAHLYHLPLHPSPNAHLVAPGSVSQQSKINFYSNFGTSAICLSLR